MSDDFDVFFRQHERRIHYQIHKLTIPLDLYDDFYAEGLVVLWRAYHEYDPKKGEIGPFLNFRIKFRLIDLQRKLIRDNEKDDLSKDGQMVEVNPGNRSKATNAIVVDPSSIDVTDEGFWLRIEEILTEKQWKWLVHFVMHDLSVKQIAEIENVSETAVKSWGRGARMKLNNDAFRERVMEAIQRC